MTKKQICFSLAIRLTIFLSLNITIESTVKPCYEWKGGQNGGTWSIDVETCYADFRTEKPAERIVFDLIVYHINIYPFENAYCERNIRAFSILIYCVFNVFLTTKNFYCKQGRTYRKIPGNHFCHQEIRIAYTTTNGGQKNGAVQRRVIIYNVLNVFDNNSICIIHIIHTHRVVPGVVQRVKLNDLFVLVLHTYTHSYTHTRTHTQSLYGYCVT